MRGPRRFLTVVAFLAAAEPAVSQAPAGADHLSASYRAVAESLAVLKSLADKVKAHYNDPETWYRQGMIAWTLYEACRHVPRYDILDCTRPRLLADTALMIAGELKPDDDTYALALTRFLLSSEGTFRRESPYLDRIFKTSVERMRRNPDPIKHADAALDAGRLYWLRYDSEAHRDWESAPAKDVHDLALKLTPADLKDILGGVTRETMRQARNVLDGKLLAAAKNDFWGSADYARAESFFREAFQAAPEYARSYRLYATLLADRNRWPELRTVAAARLAKVPADGWAWMSVALADYRAGDKRTAASEFDSAQKLLTDKERKHVIAIQRLLQPIERLKFEKDNKAFMDTYWDRVAPLWSARTDDDPYLEFLARVAYAELVWTAPETLQHGVDSDRGDAYVRFGPPDRIYTNRNDKATARVTGTIRWDYDYNVGTPRSFVFPRVPNYRTNSYSDDTVRVSGPSARWDNLIHGRIDSIPVQLARFRAQPDSVDLYFATKPPIDAIRKSVQVTASPVRTDFWLQTSERAAIVHDSIVADSGGLRAFTRRVAPGAYYYRTEASGNAALVAGRASSAISANDDLGTGFTVHGFGLSDLLLGTRADARTAVPQRWTDIDVVPLLSSVKRNTSLSLVWETYGLQPVDDQMRYGVTIIVRSGVIERPGAQGPPNVGVRVTAGAAGIQRSAVNNGVQFMYERTLPYRDVAVDNITIALVNTKPATYTVMVRITDRVSGKSIAGTRRITIAP